MASIRPQLAPSLQSLESALQSAIIDLPAAPAAEGRLLRFNAALGHLTSFVAQLSIPEQRGFAYKSLAQLAEQVSLLGPGDQDAAFQGLDSLLAQLPPSADARDANFLLQYAQAWAQVSAKPGAAASHSAMSIQGLLGPSSASEPAHPAVQASQFDQLVLPSGPSTNARTWAEFSEAEMGKLRAIVSTPLQGGSEPQSDANRLALSAMAGLHAWAAQRGEGEGPALREALRSLDKLAQQALPVTPSEPTGLLDTYAPLRADLLMRLRPEAGGQSVLARQCPERHAIHAVTQAADPVHEFLTLAAEFKLALLADHLNETLRREAGQALVELAALLALRVPELRFRATETLREMVLGLVFPEQEKQHILRDLEWLNIQNPVPVPPPPAAPSAFLAPDGAPTPTPAAAAASAIDVPQAPPATQVTGDIDSLRASMAALEEEMGRQEPQRRSGPALSLAIGELRKQMYSLTADNKETRVSMLRDLQNLAIQAGQLS